MSEPLLKPVERKKLTEGLAYCASCRDNLAILKQLQHPVEEEERRVEEAYQKISGALALDEYMSKSKSESE